MTNILAKPLKLAFHAQTQLQHFVKQLIEKVHNNTNSNITSATKYKHVYQTQNKRQSKLTGHFQLGENYEGI